MYFFFLSYELYSESLALQRSSRASLRESNKKLNLLNELVSQGRSKRIGLFSKKTFFTMLEASDGEFYCRIEDTIHSLIRVFKNGEIRYWNSLKKPFEINSKKPPLFIGYLYNYGNNLFAILEDPKEHMDDSSHKVEDLLLDNNGALKAFSTEQDWYSKENCSRTKVL